MALTVMLSVTVFLTAKKGVKTRNRQFYPP